MTSESLHTSSQTTNDSNKHTCSESSAICLSTEQKKKEACIKNKGEVLYNKWEKEFEMNWLFGSPFVSTLTGTL